MALVLRVQLLEQVELGALCLARHGGVADILDELLDVRVLRVDVGALETPGRNRTASFAIPEWDIHRGT